MHTHTHSYQFSPSEFNDGEGARWIENEQGISSDKEIIIFIPEQGTTAEATGDNLHASSQGDSYARQKLHGTRSEAHRTLSHRPRGQRRRRRGLKTAYAAAKGGAEGERSGVAGGGGE